MPRAAAKPRAPPPAESDLSLRTLSDLLEDTVLLAAEEGAAVACSSFTEFISAALPPDMLDSLAELMGGNIDDGAGGADWLLQEIWEERFAPKDNAEECADVDRPSDCQVCERRVNLTRHHLFPREMHKFCLKRGVATAQELELRVLHCCRLCHNAIHRFFTNEDLALQYNTLELLLSDEKFFRFARWNAAQPAGRNGKCR